MNKPINWILIILILITVYIIYDNNKRENLLNGKTIKTKAIVTKFTTMSVRSPARIYYQYTVEKKDYIDFDHGSNPNLKIGDTILIEYAVENPAYSMILKRE